MPGQKDHSKDAYIRAAKSVKRLRADMWDAQETVRQVVPKTYARDLDRILDAIIRLEITIEDRAGKDFGDDFDPFE